MIRTIKHNKHLPTIPKWPITLRSKIAYRISFLNGYDLKTADQLDWCKLFGIGFNLFPRIKHHSFLSNKKNVVIWKRFFFNQFVIIKGRHINSVMFGFRFNVELDEYEICKFIHKDYEFQADETKIYKVKLDIGADYYLTYIKHTGIVKLEIKRNEKLLWYNFDLFKSNKKVFQFIDLYFGGDKKAPNDIHIKTRKL